ncbi:hypothetical protein F5B22DRAFT_601832 [Xylaria bambusicola]|uniref:uncharacterized protein n=1 Tax=Xylaria bambusicola TaxID=326684 RepID=UPI0020075D6C|nr:uncharacterized protein F5B22DRAFT_601832 [Xylaria bambusicola]KAI0517677.1 hypothetical protein F5B22DRAFT_601832 [Xylaria bambusicola]
MISLVAYLPTCIPAYLPTYLPTYLPFKFAAINGISIENLHCRLPRLGSCSPISV